MPAASEVDAALTELARQHSGRVLAILANRFGSVDLADDAVQDALVRAHDRWPHDGIPDNPPAWLMTVARRRLVDHWRRQDRTQRLLDRMGPQSGPVAASFDRGGCEWLDDLPDTYRLVLVGRYVVGRSVADLASQLGVSYDAASSVLARARRAARVVATEAELALAG